MKLVKFSVMCLAVYPSELEVPDEVAENTEELVKYIREHLPEAPVLDHPEYLEDAEEAVTEADIKSVEDIEE